MNIIHISNYRSRGGGTTIARLLALRLPEKSSLVFLEPGGTRSGPEGVPPEYACDFLDFAFVHELVKAELIRRRHVILHCHGRRPGLWGQILRARYPKHLRTVVSFHGIASFDRMKKSFVAVQESVLSLVTDQFIAAGPAEVGMFRHIPMAAPIALIPSGFNPEAVVEWQVRPIRRVGFCARFERPKLHDYLIRVISAYNKTAKIPISLVFAGDGSLRPEMDALGKDILGENFSSLGHIDHIAEFYGQIDAFAHFSRLEGLPVSLVDAMACGMPCIATNVIGCRDAIEDGVSGLLVPLDDIESSVRQLRRLVEDEGGTACLASNARKRAQTVFAPDRFWALHFEIYERLAKRMGATWP